MFLRRLFLVISVFLITLYFNCKASRKSSSLEGIGFEGRSGNYLIYVEDDRLVKSYCGRSKAITLENCKLQRASLDYESFKKSYENFLFNGSADLELEISRLNIKKAKYLKSNPNADDLTLRTVTDKLKIFQKELEDTAAERLIFQDVLRKFENREEIITYKEGFQKDRPGYNIIEKIAKDAFARNGNRLALLNSKNNDSNIKDYLQQSFTRVGFKTTVCYRTDLSGLSCWQFDTKNDEALSVGQYDVPKISGKVYSVVPSKAKFDRFNFVVLEQNQKLNTTEINFCLASYPEFSNIKKSVYAGNLSNIGAVINLGSLGPETFFYYRSMNKAAIWSATLDSSQSKIISENEVNFEEPFDLSSSSVNLDNFDPTIVGLSSSGNAVGYNGRFDKSNKELFPSNYFITWNFGPRNKAADGTLKYVLRSLNDDGNPPGNFYPRFVPEERGMIDLVPELPWNKRYFLLDQSGLSSVQVEKEELVYEKLIHNFDLTEVVEIKSSGLLLCVTGENIIQCDRFVDPNNINKLSGKPVKINLRNPDAIVITPESSIRKR